MTIFQGVQPPLTWFIDPLGSLVESVRASARISPDEVYELWSVPSFSDGTPEVVNGASIGSGKLELRPNDVLISKINPRINRVWLVSEPKEQLTQIGSTEWLVARIRSGVPLLPLFLTYYMSSPLVREAIKSMTQGVTGSHTRAKANQILTIPVPHPSPAEQERIVEILEEQLSRLDAAVKSVQTVREKAAQFRRSLLHAAFTGALTQQVPGRMSNGSLPPSWAIQHLSSLVDVLDSRRKPVNSEERASRVGDVPYYGATGQVGTIDKLIFDEPLVLLGEDGVQFFDVNKPKSYEISGPAWVNNHAHVLRARDDVYMRQLLVHYLNQFDYRGFANGTTRLKLTQAAMNRIPVVVPPIREQERIVEILEEQLSRLDATLAVADEVERKSNALRRSLLHAAFTGELTRSWREAHV